MAEKSSTIALLPAEIEAMFAQRCEFGLVQYMRVVPCGPNHRKLIEVWREYQICDGHFRWRGKELVIKEGRCLPFSSTRSKKNRRTAAR